MKLSLGFSTCPNDTFIFDAIVNKRIDTEGLSFEVFMADVEELNHHAIKADMDVSKLSYHAYAYVADKYAILNAGSALGRGNGPLFVSKRKVYLDEVPHITIAVPGRYTTAAFLLKTAFQEIKEPREYLFSDIEEVVLSNETDAGVLIHESRFTYAKKGLQLISDLGAFWEGYSGKSIPLGCIAVSRKLPIETQRKIDRVLHRSVEFALQNPSASCDFVRFHAQEIDENVMQKHIALFVNNYTVNLGEEGRQAVEFFLNEAIRIKIIAQLPEQLFVG
ncbi:MAG: 1,4-dihydroxy-6-naphthoate synthase [Prevotellaceae bacterium]|jgi:1,4-dihydroxy-6-naphthoate synthase|nr:1,4-dihydroxy-6-naphthoate synthase [Prevotellaceae bacterium]